MFAASVIHALAGRVNRCHDSAAHSHDLRSGGFLSWEATVATWFGRRRAPESHPALQQVDRLLSGRPEELEVPIAGLPGRLDRLFSIYEDLFELRDYRVTAVDRRLDDLWIARIARASGSGNG